MSTFLKGSIYDPFAPDLPQDKKAEFLVSDTYCRLLTGFARGITGNPKIQVVILPPFSEALGYTDGNTIYLCTVHEMFIHLPIDTITEFVLAVALHEPCHVLYTDFKYWNSRLRSIARGVHLYKWLFNSICDARIERIGCIDFPGIKHYLIDFRNFFYEYDDGTPVKGAQALLNNILLFATCGKVKYPMTQEAEALFEQCRPYIIAGRRADTTADCDKNVSEIFDIIYEYVKNEQDMPENPTGSITSKKNSKNFKKNAKTGGADSIQFDEDMETDDSDDGDDDGEQDGNSSGSGKSKKSSKKSSNKSSGGKSSNADADEDEDEDGDGNGSGSDKKDKKSNEDKKSSGSGKTGDEDEDEDDTNNGSSGNSDKDSDEDGSDGSSDDKTSDDNASSDKNDDADGSSNDGDDGDNDSDGDDADEDDSDGDNDGDGNDGNDGGNDQGGSDGGDADGTSISDLEAQASREMLRNAIEGSIPSFEAEKEQKAADANRMKSLESESTGTTSVKCIHASANNDPMYAEITASASPVINHLVSEMRKVINWNQDEICHKQGRGYLDPQSLTYSHRGTCFGRRIEKSDEADLFISIIVDSSGSMSGQRLMNTAVTSAIILEACSALKIPVTIKGFASGYRAACDITHYWDYQYKNQNCKHNLIQMYASGGTPLAEALAYEKDYLSKVRFADKLVFVLTDGEPNNTSSAIAQVARLSQDALVYGVAIGDDVPCLKGIFGENRFIDARDIKTLPFQIGNIIKRNIIR